jgi:hypothetical protein
MSPSNPPDSKHPRKSKQHTQEDKGKNENGIGAVREENEN